MLCKLFYNNFFPMRSFSNILKHTIKLGLKTPVILKFNQPSNITSIGTFCYRPLQSFSTTQNNIKSSYKGEGFYMQQLLVGCLAIYSYYIESNGEAWIIDPQNDIAKYNDIIKQRKSVLKGVFLTHYHADYIAGHNELKNVHKECNVYMGPTALQEKGVTVIKDNQIKKLGSISLQLIHTPGHTQQSSCLLLLNAHGKQDIVFTGDTVFLNQVGRPDLAVKTNRTARDLAEMLFDSVQKIKKINNHVRIYPGHGSGSACGKSIGAGDFCDIVTQKHKNYALKQSSKAEFVQQVLKQMPTPPSYFGYNATLNKFNEFSYEQAFKNCNKKLSIQQFLGLKQNGLKVIDIRSIPQLSNGIIDGAICIDYNGGFANWVGSLISHKQDFILFGDQNTSVQAIKRLLRIGYINIKGFSGFSIAEWQQKGLKTYKPDWAQTVFQQGRTVIDVRKPDQWKTTGVADTPNLINFQLSDLFDNVQKLDKSKKYITHCKSGYRSRIAYSFLKSKGYDVKSFAQAVEKIQKFKPYNN